MNMIDRRRFIATLAAMSARVKRPFSASLLAATACEAARASGRRTLRSRSLEVELLATGAIARITNRGARETYSLSQDTFVITTSSGVFSSRGLASEAVEEGTDGILSYRFRNQGEYVVLLRYRLAANGESIERWLEIEDLRIPLDLLKVEMGWAFEDRSPGEAVDYATFWNTPTTVFLRWPRGGLFTGIENPFFRTEVEKENISLTYEPSLLLKPGDTYESDPHYLGVYARSGRMLTDHSLPTLTMNRPITRFRNPCGHIPLDCNEIQAMRRFVLGYLAPRSDQFTCALYMYWYPIEQLWEVTSSAYPDNAELEAKYKRVVENVSELGGDLIIFNPLFPYSRPAADSSAYWNLAPENSSAGRVLALAQEKGIDCGFYMGVAANGEQGNAAALPFAEEKPSWKKTDLAGGMSGENCIACRGYADWWFAVQRNTIARFDLKFWSWDPGPGNGSFCYSSEHGHIPGKGTYKGWREVKRLARRLKDEFPKLKLQAFYGRKEYGLWGLKHFDMQESYWEQTILYGATKHPDLHDDRINADGARYQSWWNENFRFLPTAMNHALVHRIGENSYDSRLPKAWDMLGWRYSLLSAIASSGNAIACILPEDLSRVPEFVAFYKKWLGWARANFEYVRYNISLGDQLRPGGVDIYARIRQDHGFIFICNAALRPARAKIALDASVGVQVEGSFTLRELHPSGGPLYFDPVHQRGIFSTGDEVSVTIPAHEVCLFELNRFSPAQLPLIFGVAGRVETGSGKIVVEEMAGQPGERAELMLLTEKEQEVPAVTLNNKLVSWTPAGPYRRAVVQFEGKALPRALDRWRLPDGKPFTFPFHEAADTLDLETNVFLEASIQRLLARNTPSNLAEYQDLLANWRQTLPHNFAWARPDRMWFVLPFTNADYVKEASLRLNGRPVPLEWSAPRDRHSGSRIIAYADLTDFVDFGVANRLTLQLRGIGPNQFLGPELDYPLEVPVAAWSLASKGWNEGVTYTGPIDPDLPNRVASASNLAPRVLSVEVTPNFIVAGAKHTFFAEIDLPAERLASVWISVSQDADMPMTWDTSRKKWIFEWTVPDRAMDILDVDRAVVWAVAQEGTISSTFSISLRWLFATPSREKIEWALESPWPNVREDARALLAALSGTVNPPTR
jgi:hypothetical protein